MMGRFTGFAIWMVFESTSMGCTQLEQGATSRSVFLPRLPAGSYWQNVFTEVVTDTSHGGVNITEATPLSGDGFGTFPLYKISRGIPYPTPPSLTCDASKCNFLKNTDKAIGDEDAFYNSSSPADCCAKCLVRLAEVEACTASDFSCG
eukprot:m.1633977 g.1633977  ORF g.1633977 m.1633977 type:complete len:148 (-) comp25412_c0_seq5:27-470(-)